MTNTSAPQNKYYLTSKTNPMNLSVARREIIKELHRQQSWTKYNMI